MRLDHNGLKTTAVGLEHRELRDADEGMPQQCAWCDALVTIQTEHLLQQFRESARDRLVCLISCLHVKSEMI